MGVSDRPLKRLPLMAVGALVVVWASTTAAFAQASVVNVHTVEAGESLRSIAQDYGVSTDTVLAANSLDDPDLIRVGQELVVPAVDGVLHTVRDGETLRGIADAYDVPIADLVSANGLDASPDLVVVGTVLVVPGAKPEVEVVAAPKPAQVAATVAPTPPPTPAAAPTPPPPPPSPPQTDRVISAMVTGYAPGAGAVSSRTASGATTHWGTVAADTHLYPFGTRLRIEGLGDMVFVVEDTGGAVHGNVFDVWFPDAASARAIATRMRHVTVLEPGEQ
jgi:LysM repeat protein/3D (Asp-Asp-Asp) domain-containing protein